MTDLKAMTEIKGKEMNGRNIILQAKTTIKYNRHSENWKPSDWKQTVNGTLYTTLICI